MVWLNSGSRLSPNSGHWAACGRRPTQICIALLEVFVSVTQTEGRALEKLVEVVKQAGEVEGGKVVWQVLVPRLFDSLA